MLIKSLFLFGFLVLLAGACGSKSGGGNTAQVNAPQTASSTPNVESAKPEISRQPAASQASNPLTFKAGSDACALIEKSEIESVQGGTVQGMVPSKREADALAISQCYYTVFSSDRSKDLSVHLEVTQNDKKSANQNTVGDLWRERFEGASATKKMEKPKRVHGIGDGAYWVGNNKAGALYVLKKDRLVRISIGGPEDEGKKIQKLKTLAEKALTRLD